MPELTIFSNLVASLLEATTFEQASQAVLRPMLDTAERALVASRHGSSGRLLRAMIHVRPEGGYRRLAVLEHGQSQVDLMGEPSYLPPATAWRYVAEHRRPVAVDVNLGRIEPLGKAAVVVKEALVRPPATLGGESVARLIGRAASHLVVVPLWAAGEVIGMISIEADCQRAIGREFIWAGCQSDLQLLANVAAPYLGMLPVGEVATVPTDAFLPVVGASMAAIVRIARIFAAQDETLLIGGPTGAGKSRLARWCHEQSTRRAARFEGLDLMTIPEELQMGELFGWKKGAFSGAASDNPGSISRADKGTLFIDEIDKLSLKAQAGLLRVLEERTYRPLGEGTGDRKADVRFLVGTNADLMAAVRGGKFREDLYFRINVLPIRLPPLDERTDEITGWAKYMLDRRHRERNAHGEASLTEEAMRILLAQRWPGNLRQLDNVVRRGYALALVEQAEATHSVVLDESHIQRALGYEARTETTSLVDALKNMTLTLLREAEQQRAGGKLLDIDVVEALRGMALAIGAKRLGSKEAAYRLLGKESVVSSRNHQRAYRRELDRTAQLLRALGPEGQSLAEELLEAEVKQA